MRYKLQGWDWVKAGLGWLWTGLLKLLLVAMILLVLAFIGAVGLLLFFKAKGY